MSAGIMNLTKAQLRGLWFLVLVCVAAVAVHYVKVLFFPLPAYDFSVLEAAFNEKRDSLRFLEMPVDLENHTIAEKQQKEPVLSWQKFPVNINTAGLKELQYLPRIGPAMAKRIIAYREEIGSFRMKEDIMKVKGIGKKTFENLEDLIVTE
jgi:comEA protein